MCSRLVIMSVAGGEPAEGEVLQSHILDGEHALCSEWHLV
jgi:hypothetical protein